MALNRNLRKWLENHFKGIIKYDEPMSKHTSFRIGGPADVYAEPGNIEELTALVGWSCENSVPHIIIGDGTNLLVKDSGISGIVITMTKGLKKIEVKEKKSDYSIVSAMAGARMQSLCRFALDNSLAGTNPVLGIPGTVGGGIMMNAGTSLGSVETILKSINILLPAGQIRSLARQNMNFSYRRLTLNESEKGTPLQNPVIIDGTFYLYPSDPEHLRNEARNILEKRNSQQPAASPSAGCFFKNPESGKTAGELIDRAGLKGTSIGGAQISEKHANFIINRNKATACDVLELMELTREKVLEMFNIKLEPEVKIVD